jgi:hypothetical protein
MQAVFDHAQFRLQSPDTMLLKQNAPSRITVLTGELWVTRDGEVQDHILVRGESIALNQGRNVLLTALSSVQVDVRQGHTRGRLEIVLRNLRARYLRWVRVMTHMRGRHVNVMRVASRTYAL